MWGLPGRFGSVPAARDLISFRYHTMHMRVSRKNGNGPVEKLILEAATDKGQAALEDILSSLQAAQPDHAKVKEILKTQAVKVEDSKTPAPREAVATPAAPKEKTADVQSPK